MTGVTPVPPLAVFAMPDTTVNVVRIPAELRAEAASRLAGDGAGSIEAGRRLLQTAEAYGYDLNNLWGSQCPRSGRVHQVCLVTPAPGRTGMVFTSKPGDGEQHHALAAVVRQACEHTLGIVLAQALLEMEDVAAMTVMADAGFFRVGELLYLRRPWKQPSSQAKPWPADVRVRNWRTGDDPALIHALERTYTDTQDCPELRGLRDTHDVLASHRATGRFDPRLWWLLWQGDEPVGAMLLNPCPDQNHTELVYLGLAPELRGRGLSTALLRLGLSSLASMKQRTVTCAVDSRNAPARRLYERAGFGEFARRVAMVRPTRPHCATSIRDSA